MQKIEHFLDIGGRTMTVILSDLANKANGSAIVRLGDTMVLATAVMSREPNVNLNYLPLTVDYEERFYAAGQILGSRFMRREGRPSDEAILSGRVVDRTIRPLFDSHIRNEIQIVITILSLGEYDPDVLAVNAASLALSGSNIPWNGPVSALRVGKKSQENHFITNPTFLEREAPENQLDLVVCGRDETINMIEVGAKQIEEKFIVDAFNYAIPELQKLQSFQEKIASEHGKQKIEIKRHIIPEEVKKIFAANIFSKLEAAVFSGPEKQNIYDLNKEWLDIVSDKLPGTDRSVVQELYDQEVSDILHKEAIYKKRRPDGRVLDEIRPLYAQAGNISPMLHGSGIFYRGNTHVLSALTLGGPHQSLIIDAMEIQTKKHFIHHYNFPPFAPGETGRMGGLNRRMIGHGALAEKALLPVIPSIDEFPYTIRVVSEVMSSNGSTSMASTCAATLAFMDAGVPIKAPVAGIASGVMYEDPEHYVILTDIQGPEDEHGDMDFKVAGTRSGVTAIQMDVKVNGLPVKILEEALEKAKEARLKILDVIESEIASPRPNLSQNAPRVSIVKIKQEQIGLVIGSGGRTVNEIKGITDTEIEIEDDGTIYITGKNEGPERAKQIILEMTREFVAGERLTGTITRIADFGAFVKIGPRTEGLVHISEIAPFRVANINRFLKEGQTVPVIVKEVSGPDRVSLSIKEADPDMFSHMNRDQDYSPQSHGPHRPERRQYKGRGN